MPQQFGEEPVADMSKPLLIKRYASRRLYNTETSDYVTLEDIAAFIREGREVQIVDLKSGDDLTRQYLLQIIADHESKGESVLPVDVLTDLVRSYTSQAASVVPHVPTEAPTPRVDVQAIVSRMAHHARIGPIVARFVQQLPAKLTQMDDALRTADLSALASLAHWLKGAGGSMGFDDLFEPSKALEEAALQGDAVAAARALAEVRRLGRCITKGAELLASQAEVTQA